MTKYTYQSTEIEFLGNIPNHWKFTKIKNEFKVIPSNVDKKINDDETSVKLCNYVDVYYNQFITLDIPFMEATANENEIDKFQLKVGDILITKDSEDPFDIGIPAIIDEVEPNLLCGYHLTFIRTINNKILSEFLFWSLMDKAIVSQLNREATGVTRWAISSRHIKNCIIPFPPIKEQESICKYLRQAWLNIDKILKIKFGNGKLNGDDHETNQLKLLLDYRDSLIHECVTGKKQVWEGETEKLN